MPWEGANWWRRKGLPVRAPTKLSAQAHNLFEPIWYHLHLSQPFFMIGQHFPLGISRVNSTNEQKPTLFAANKANILQIFDCWPVWLTTKPFPGTFISGEKGRLFFPIHWTTIVFKFGIYNPANLTQRKKYVQQNFGNNGNDRFNGFILTSSSCQNWRCL